MHLHRRPALRKHARDARVAEAEFDDRAAMAGRGGGDTRPQRRRPARSRFRGRGSRERRRRGRDLKLLDRMGQSLLGVKRGQPQLPAHAWDKGAGWLPHSHWIICPRQGQPEHPSGDASGRGGRGCRCDNGALARSEDDLRVRDDREVAESHIANPGDDGLAPGRAHGQARPAAQRARTAGGIAEHQVPCLFPHPLRWIALDGGWRADLQVAGPAPGCARTRGGGRAGGGRPS